MNVRILLADAAEAGADGKVHSLGLAWTITRSPTAGMAVVVIIDLSPEDLDTDHSFSVRLLKGDGSGPVNLPRVDGEGSRELAFQGVFSAAKDDGLPPDMPIRVSFAATIGPGLVLDPGVYRWQAEIDDQTEEGWSERFFVKAIAEVDADGDERETRTS